MSKYFQASAPIVYFQLNRAACEALVDFKPEGPRHPRCQLVAKATLGLASAQMEIVDADDCSAADSMRNSLKRTAMMVHNFSGDFGLSVVPFEMVWPDIGDPGALDAMADMLGNLTLDDFKSLNDGIAGVVPSVTENEEKNSDGESV